MEHKVGMYLCAGCGIGESVDMEKLAKVAGESKPALTKTHPFFCSPEGVQLIKDDIAKEGVNSVVIAACSPRVNYDVFDFGPEVLIDRVNIREQVAWVQPPKHEDTQMMAEDYVRMGGAKIKKTEFAEAFTNPEFSKTVMVVGGGVTGLTAALETANTGYSVVLVEKEAQLGGYAAHLHKKIPSKPPYRDPEDNGMAEKIQKATSHPKIKIYTSAEVKKTTGGPGTFEVEIAAGGKTVTEKIGAIVLATGMKPYDANKLGHLGYGASPNVITSVTMEELAAGNKLARPSDKQPVKRVAFIQCAGSRDPNHLPYCSNMCCNVSLKQAVYVKEKYPDAQVTIIYDEMRTQGQVEEFYRRVQKDGVIFLRGKVTGVSAGGDKTVTVTVDDFMKGQDVRFEGMDLVVLAIGMEPVIKTGSTEEESILNLQYRQGPDLPLLNNGFPDSHFICFPYETRRTGIYTAGPVRRPMGIADAVEDGTGAALKAIQAIEKTFIGQAVHPRVGDLSYPIINLQGCTQCKRCTEECPFGALNEDAKTNPILNTTRCRRCGICMGACPVRVISFKNYSIDQVGSMLKVVEIPDEDEEKPRVLVFACENDAYPALDMAGIARMNYSPFVRVIPVRCLGSVNQVWIADALSSGFDGVMMMGCRHGDDYQCHFIRGSALAEERMEKISETLNRLKLESERVRTVEVGITDSPKIPEYIGDFMKMIDQVGPNPFKGF